MAEKADKKDKTEAPAPAKEAEKNGVAKPAAGGVLAKTPVMLGAVMLLEAAVLFAGFKFLGGGPGHAIAVDLGSGDKSHSGTADKAGTKPGDRKLAEINVVDVRAPNTQNGRRYIYDVSIYIIVASEFEQRVKETLKERDAMIRDRIRTIIAQMDPEKLGGGSEPGLETLRRQVKKQLEIIIGDDMIHEVLVPRCIPFRADF